MVLVTMVSLPWATPSADAATGDLDVPLGDTSVQISYVRTVESADPITDTASDGYNYTSYPWEWGRTRACIRYSPGSQYYSTDTVYGSGGQYAAVGYGRPAWDANSCSSVYRGESADKNQTSLGFQPSNTTSIKVGQVFLVGRMRHVNSPIYTDSSRVTTLPMAEPPTTAASTSVPPARLRRTSPGGSSTRSTRAPGRSGRTASS